ncbi:MAG: conjugal transfer protein TrbL family protein [Clostridium paraputrificum]
MWLLSKLQEMLLNSIADFINGWISTFSKYIDNTFALASEVVKGDVITKLTSYTLKLALSVLIFITIAQVIRLYVLNEDGDPDDNIVAFFIRLGKSVILMTFSTYICTAIVTFSDFVANDVRKVLSGSVKVSDKFIADINVIITYGFGKALTFLFLLVLTIVALMIITVQAGIRGVNLAVLQVVAPLTATNYVTTDKGLWKKWVQKMVSVSFTYVFQMTFLNIGMSFIGNGIVGGFTNVLIGLCWLIACIKVPSFLDEFAYATGVGSGMSKSVNIMQTVAMLAK